MNYIATFRTLDNKCRVNRQISITLAKFCPTPSNNFSIFILSDEQIERFLMEIER